MTRAIQAQLDIRRIRLASPGQDSYPSDEGVQQLSLNTVEGQKKTFSRDELWKTYGPQTLQEPYAFVRRVTELSREYFHGQRGGAANRHK